MKSRILFIYCAVVAQFCFASGVPFELTVIEKSLSFAAGAYDVGDIDHDDKNDIIASGNNPRLWWAKHSNPLQRYKISDDVSIGFEIHVGDVDNDGDLDVLTSGDGLTWLEHPGPKGNPATDKWKKHSIDGDQTGSNGGSHDFKVGDINADGKIDAVERNKTSKLSIYIQNSPDSWALTHAEFPKTKEGTWLGDIDRDGDLDVSDGWHWLECPGSPKTGDCNPLGSWTRHDVGNAGHNLTRVNIADINGDQLVDIVCCPAEYGGNKLVWFEAPKDPKNGKWKEHEIMTPYKDPNFHSLQIGDIDLDGYPDIFVASTHGPCSKPKIARIFFNTEGNGITWKDTTWSTEKGLWQAILGDVGSDIDLDILGADYSGGRGEFWENMFCDKGNCETAAEDMPLGLSSAADNPGISAEIKYNSLVIKNPEKSGNFCVALFDMRGKKIFTLNRSDHAAQKSVDISGFSDGCYVIEMVSPQRRSTSLITLR